MMSFPPQAARTRDRETRSAPRRFSWQLRDVWQFIVLTFRKAHHDNVFLISNALAFVTILSIIPLLATFSFVGARFFQQFERQAVEFLGGLLPYPEQTILDRIRDFLAQAENLRGLALIALLAVVLAAFATVEATINRIWNVPAGRPLNVRFLSFTLLLFWGPILIGISFAGLPFLSRLPGLGGPTLVGELATAVGTLAGLTMLYWLVPYTTVRLPAALAGSIVATVLLAVLREGFGYYVHVLYGIDIIYGSFALALFFMISIAVAWDIALLGSVVAYTAQHYSVLTRGIDETFPLEGRWAGLAVLTVMAESFLHGEPLVTHERLAERLQIRPEELPRALLTLDAEGWLEATTGPEKGYLLATDPHALTLQEIFGAYDARCREIFEPLPVATRKRLKETVRKLGSCQRRQLEAIRLADLVGAEETASTED